MMRAIDKVKDCQSMQEVRAGVNALDDILVPLLVERSGYMTQAAKVKTTKTWCVMRHAFRPSSIAYAPWRKHRAATQS